MRFIISVEASSNLTISSKKVNMLYHMYRSRDVDAKFNSFIVKQILSVSIFGQ